MGRQGGGPLSSAFSGSQRRSGSRTPEKSREEPWALAGHPQRALSDWALPPVGPRLTRGTLPTQASSSADGSSGPGPAGMSTAGGPAWTATWNQRHTHPCKRVPEAAEPRAAGQLATSNGRC